MCPECNEKLIPIHYDYVDYAVIERAIIGDLFIADKYDIASFYCKTCKIKY